MVMMNKKMSDINKNLEAYIELAMGHHIQRRS